MASRKFYYRSICTGCVWNNKRLCGRDFCMLPRCARQTETLARQTERQYIRPNC